MSRTVVSLRQAIDLDFDALIAMVNNLLINNVNFKTGHYFREYPSTQRFVACVLPLQAEGINERIERLKGLVGQNLDEDPPATDPALVAQALGHLSQLADFAYEQGYHELGYDPVQVLAEALCVPRPVSPLAAAPAAIAAPQGASA